MQFPTATERLRWPITVGLLLLGAGLLFLWWRNPTTEAPMTDPAALLPTSDVQTSSAAAGSDSSTAQLGVDVIGAVQQPGLYFFPPEARVNDAIKAAGGFAPDADRDAINLATRLKDEQQLRVPRINDTLVSAPTNQTTIPDMAVPAQPVGMTTATEQVDLNRADAATIATLPRIGPVMAQRIVDYRTTHGPFQSIDQLLDIDGIGAATIEALRNQVIIQP